MNADGRHRILIIGAGFAGIRCALKLLKKKPKNVKITLVSKNDYFEYYPAMYRVATGSSPLEACLRLQTIFRDYPIDIIEDTIVAVDPKKKTAQGKSGSTYTGDSIILAVGSEMNYFKIAGVEELSFTFKSIHQAIRLRRRIVELFENHHTGDHTEALISFHVVVVGAGPSGVELVGELAIFMRKLARMYGVDESMITIDLVDAGSRILKAFPEKVSRRATKRLRNLGVNIFSNRLVVEEESWTVFMSDMKIGAKTVVWTAGVKNNKLYETLSETFEFDRRGRVVVDEYLQAKGFDNVYVAGDNASTKHSGLAQTALHDGAFIAQNIIKKLQGKEAIMYKPKKIGYDVPIGPGWAIMTMYGITLYGWLPWFLRHLIDLRFYWSILPPHKALQEFFLGRRKQHLPEDEK